MVLQYYTLLRSVIRTRVELRRCLTRCRHCRIFFVAAASNAGRKLGCPFGCAQAHRRRQWRQTSQEYYQEPRGRRKKSALNQQQRNKAKAALAAMAPKAVEVPKEAPPPPAGAVPAPFAPILVGYVQRVVSAIEERPVSRAEILAMLAKEKRQHSMVRQRRIDQIIQSLHERPP